MSSVRIGFFGTPEFALPCLQAIHESNHELLYVVSQPDKPSGRGKKLSPPPIAAFAKEHSIPLHQPKSIKKLVYDNDTISLEGSEDSFFNSFDRPDIGIVIAYGNIIPAALLNYPKYGFLNVHPSILPRWRGAAPLRHTIFAGDTETEICIMHLEEGLDEGPVYTREKHEVSQEESHDDLHDRLSTLSAPLLLATINDIVENGLKAIEQSSEGVCYASKWEVSDCEVKWNESAEQCHNRVRASYRRPGARSQLNGELIKVLKTRVLDGNYSKEPGTLFLSEKKLAVQCGNSSAVEILELQLPGKKPIDGKAFSNHPKYKTNLVNSSLFFSTI